MWIWGLCFSVYTIYCAVSLVLEYKTYKLLKHLYHQVDQLRRGKDMTFNDHINSTIQGFCTNPRQFSYIQNSIRPLIKTCYDYVWGKLNHEPDREISENFQQQLHWLDMPPLVD